VTHEKEPQAMRHKLPGRGYPAVFFVIDDGKLRLMGRSPAFDAYRAEKVEFPPTIIKPTRDEWEDFLLHKKDVTRPWEGAPKKAPPTKPPARTPVGAAKPPAAKE
jgi:hypothetical protein